MILNTEYNEDVSYVIKDDKGNEYYLESTFVMDNKNEEAIYLINGSEIRNITIIPKTSETNDVDIDSSKLHHEQGISLEIN